MQIILKFVNNTNMQKTVQSPLIRIQIDNCSLLIENKKFYTSSKLESQNLAINSEKSILLAYEVLLVKPFFTGTSSKTEFTSNYFYFTTY